MARGQASVEQQVKGIIEFAKVIEMYENKLKDYNKIIEFLNEVEEQDWELDKEDITHILHLDFGFVRKQYTLQKSENVS